MDQANDYNSMDNNTAAPLAIPMMPPMEVAERIEVMRWQEETTYTCNDFFGEADRACFQHCTNNSSVVTNPLEQAAAFAAAKIQMADVQCRVKMCEWSYQVVDFCKFRRETVDMSMSFLDRFLSSQTPAALNALMDRKEYQLASMTALYMAIKLFEPMEMETTLLAELSRGCYSAAEVADMEKSILVALQWRVNGPTRLSFAQHLLALLPAEILQQDLIATTLLDLTRFQTELATGDYYFTTRKVSTAAVACVLNALDAVGPVILSDYHRQCFYQSLLTFTDIHPFAPEVDEARLRLLNHSGLQLNMTQIVATHRHKLMAATSTTTSVPMKNVSGDNDASSPICVSRIAAAMEP